jgi:shikimate kinase
VTVPVMDWPLLVAANRDELWRNGVVVYLQADADLLFERTSRDQTRPLLQTANPRERIAALLAARAPFYEQADLTVAIRGKSLDQICEEILTRWRTATGR